MKKGTKMVVDQTFTSKLFTTVFTHQCIKTILLSRNLLNFK